MELKRQKPVVEAYHFDMKPQEQELETKINVSFSPLKVSDEAYMQTNSILGAALEYQLVFPKFVITGKVGQITHILNRKITVKEDLEKEEIDEIIAPLFDMIQRLTYEVTEIITDEPGIKLNFNSASEEEK